ncbi:hypothetical protein OIDMADRAFT_17667 [Oidiodendron maius Zn]|uniref:Uncharacterized protein n=1 Tax=Oidiodendron maius (strain Zn) TaxID=913774 RepID=A0A0C3HP11_OIDMZ|nr:hypothetical protein OIDMADRAFT_17667 [Oidiodendron maius Zn]
MTIYGILQLLGYIENYVSLLEVTNFIRESSGNNWPGYSARKRLLALWYQPDKETRGVLYIRGIDRNKISLKIEP